ncbi:MAG: hypothetical protein JF607_23850 [Burkholderiales bacterium]|jgi:hypothetical protein|nr:hypothetical protein [Burkholderiales bacterium]
MLVLVVRQPRPDARYWTGRRWLAAVDALAWPIAWIAVIHALPARAGLFGSCVTAICVLAALSRLHRAVCENNRYWFTTWKWGRVAFAVWLAGVVMKLTLVG